MNLVSNDNADTLANHHFTQQTAAPVSPYVLIVEDHKDSREMMKFFLETKGYQTLATKDDEQAMTLIQESPPDLIILNISLPTNEGLEMLRRMRAQSLFHDAFLIVTSSYPDQAFRSETLQSGGDAFFLKPIDLNKLVDIVEDRLNH